MLVRSIRLRPPISRIRVLPLWLLTAGERSLLRFPRDGLWRPAPGPRLGDGEFARHSAGESWIRTAAAPDFWGRAQDAVAAYDDVVNRFGSAAELGIRKLVANALLELPRSYGSAICLLIAFRPDFQAIKLQNELFLRCSRRNLAS